jgi:hypothetical protein
VYELGYRDMIIVELRQMVILLNYELYDMNRFRDNNGT